MRRLAEVLADVLVERRLVVPAAPAPAARIVDATEVARLLGRDRRWVYAHAGELGAFRYGDGPRARLGFDLTAVERWKRRRQIAPAHAQVPRPRPRGRAAAVTTLIPYDDRPARS